MPPCNNVAATPQTPQAAAAKEQAVQASYSGRASLDATPPGAPAPLPSSSVAIAAEHDDQLDQPSSSPSGNIIPLTVAVPLEGLHELQAAMHVLEYMYTGQLPPAASPLELLQMRKQAQYLLCAPCDAACAAAANAAAVTPKDALEVYAEPGAVQDSALNQLIENCWEAVLRTLLGTSGPDDDAGVLQVLLARLGSTLEIMRSPELQKLWLALPMGALQLLLSSNSRMAIDCEESVLLLLHRWVSHAADRAQHGKQLRGLLSPLDLGPAYLQHVMPKLTWLGLAAQELPDLLYLGHSCSLLDESLRTSEDVRAAIERRMPVFSATPQWIRRRPPADSRRSPSTSEAGGTTTSSSGARNGSSGSGSPSREQRRTVTLQLEVERSVLEEELSAFQSTLSAAAGAPGSQASSQHVVARGSRVYCAGYEWRLVLQLSGCAAAPASAEDGGGPVSPACWPVKGGLFVRCSVPAELESLGVVTYALTLSSEVGVAGRDGWPLRAYCYATGGAGWGFPGLLMGAGALDMSAWERYLGDGGVLRAHAEVCLA